MKFTDHIYAVLKGDHAPRVVERDGKHYAWTATWEGPVRPDYPAALADLHEKVSA